MNRPINSLATTVFQTNLVGGPDVWAMCRNLCNLLEFFILYFKKLILETFELLTC